MTENELQSIFNSLGTLTLIGQYFSDRPELLEDLVDISLDDSRAKSWRAVWMVDKIHEKHPELVIPYLRPMIHFVLTTKNAGKKRHFLKLISLHVIPDEMMAILLNYCIEVFANAAEPVAVRVHAMQILFNIAQREPDFAGELIDLIEHEIEYHGSAGITSRGKKLIKKLNDNGIKKSSASQNW